jgi:hypothetical protein
MGTTGSFSRDKTTTLWSLQSLHSSAKAGRKNAWSFIPLLPYTFMAWYIRTGKTSTSLYVEKYAVALLGVFLNL